MNKALQLRFWGRARSARATLAIVAVCATAATAMEGALPWDLSTEERLRKWQELATASTSADPRTRDGGSSVLRLSGKTNPELFLRWQLFDHLVASALVETADQSAVFREAIETSAVALGFGADIWSRLEKAAAAFVESRRRGIALARQLASAESMGMRSAAQAELTELSEKSCGLRQSALAAAQRDFGTKELDSLLYQAIAPDLELVADASDLDLQQLRWVEEGCK